MNFGESHPGGDMLQGGALNLDELALLVRRDDYAHVLDEHVESKYDGATGEGWLQGRLTYMLYRRPALLPTIPQTTSQ
jgi:hypothetical protein